MAVVVKGKNIDVTPALRECVETGAAKLQRFFADMDIDVRAVLSVKKETQKAEITCYVEGLILRGEDSSKDMYGSIDDAFEKIVRQIHKYKTRLAKRFKKPNAFKEVAAQEAAVVQEDTLELVRRKQIPLKPMTEEEAILQMNLLNHDFFMFINAQNDQPTVVYRRKNGAYGLLEP